MLTIDFRKDWETYIKTELKSLGFSVKQSNSLESNTLQYFNIKRRILSKRVRKIHESQELYIPPKYIAEYDILRNFFTNGDDLIPYLSRKTTGQKKNYNYTDSLLNEWGITHLHFSVKGTKDVLFIMVTDEDIFVIQVFPHGYNYPYAFVNKELIEILHNNWPEDIAKYKTDIPGENLTPEQRKILQEKNHGNTIITVSDGTNYLPPGGGMTASGHCLNDRIKTDNLVNKLSEWEYLVKKNENNFRKALKISREDNFCLKISFTDEGWYLYEPNKQVRITMNHP